MMISLLGALLVVLGTAGVLAWSTDRRAVGATGWYPDPSTATGRFRWWDGEAWSSSVVRGPVGPVVRPRLRRRLGLGVVLPLLCVVAVAVAVAVVFGRWWVDGHDDLVLIGLSVLAEVIICGAFYSSVARRLALDEVVSLRTVAAAVVAGAGATFLVAMPINDVIGRYAGVTVQLLAVGPVEETAKLLVPVGLYLLGRLRSPRAGLALGLASGFGFGIAEAALYAYTVPHGLAPATCGAAGSALSGVEASLYGQLYRVVLVEPLHWLWTGFAAVVIWQAWHGTARRFTMPAVAAFLAVAACHSLNDWSLSTACGDMAWAALREVLGLVELVGMFLLLRAAARRCLPPRLVGAVGRGWHPRRLPTRADDGAPVEPAAVV